MSGSDTRAALLDLGRLGSGPSRSRWTADAVASLKTALPTNRISEVCWRAQQESVLASTAARIGVVALAGTGKTGVLAEYARRRARQKWRYLVFNRAMADEARSRMPTGVPCTTFHALAFARFGADLAAKADRPWVSEHATHLQPGLPVDWQWGALALIQATVDAFMASADHQLEAAHVPSAQWRLWRHWDKGGAIWADPSAAAAAASRLWREMVNPASAFPCPQEAWIKLAQLNGAIWSGEGWLIDEAQDMSAAMLDWVRQQPGPRICVGDPHQALYGWRTPLAWTGTGALEEDAHFTLSGSHRFGPEVADLANQVLTRMGSPDRLEGLGPSSAVIWDSRPSPSAGVAALARTQAGAQAGLSRACSSGWGLASVPQVPERWRSVAALLRGDRAAIQDPWVRGFADFSTLEAAVAEEGENWRRACAWARDALPDPPLVEGGLTVATIHQAKGRGFDQVWLLPDLVCPAGPPEAWTSGQAESARCVYVAVTRTRCRLYVDPALSGRLKSWLGGAGDAPSGGWDDGF